MISRVIPLVPIVFRGQEGVRRYVRWKALEQSNRPVMPFVDHQYAFGKEFRDLVYMTWENPLHYKGLLAMYAYEIFRQPILVCDTDWIPLRPINFEEYLPSSIAMCPDVGARTWPILDGYEHNSGLILITQSVWKVYREVWTDTEFIEGYHHIPYADQIATTRVWELLNGSLMPQEWNLSYRNRGPHRQSIHFHGVKGKVAMERYFQ